MSSACYCGSGIEFSKCCEPFLNGSDTAPTAEKLMRSRYSAFCTKQLDYIEETLDPQAQDLFNEAANKEWADRAQFTGLKIISSSESGNKSVIEFIATYTMDGKEYSHHEISKFRKQGGVWYFRDGKVKASESAGN